MAIPGVIQTGQVPGVKMGPMGIRAAAGARAVGAPKAAPKGVTKGPKVRTPPAKTAAPTKATPVKAAGFNYGNMTPAEATRYITGQVGAETKANLAPLKARQNEIGQTEGAVANRYQGYGEALTGGPRVPVGSSILGGIAGTAEQSAKTFQNNVAEEALRASKGVETAGQNALTASAGYMDPQLRATLGNQMGNINATGTAANQAAGAMGANEQNFLTNIRAAAAQRVTEGQRGIAGVYGKQRGEVQGKEQQLLARQPGAITKGVEGLLQRQFANRAAEAKLASENIKIGSKLQTEGTTRARNRAAVNKSEAERLMKETTLPADLAQKSADTMQKRNDATYKLLTAEDKTRYDNAQIEYKKYLERSKGTAGGGAPALSKTEAAKYLTGVQYALGVAQGEFRAAQKANPKVSKARLIQAVREKIQAGRAKTLAGKTLPANTLSGALNILEYGTLGPQEKTEARAASGVNAAWFRTR